MTDQNSRYDHHYFPVPCYTGEYEIWRKRMETYLDSQGLLIIVKGQGTSSSPTSEQKEKMALLIIQQGIPDSDLLAIFKSKNTEEPNLPNEARAAWEAVKEFYKPHSPKKASQSPPPTNTALYSAAMVGNIANAKKIVRRDLNLITTPNNPSDGLFPVHIAAMNRHKKMTKYLIRKMTNGEANAPLHRVVEVAVFLFLFFMLLNSLTTGVSKDNFYFEGVGPEPSSNAHHIHGLVPVEFLHPPLQITERREYAFDEKNGVLLLNLLIMAGFYDEGHLLVTGYENFFRIENALRVRPANGEPRPNQLAENIANFVCLADKFGKRPLQTFVDRPLNTTRTASMKSSNPAYTNLVSVAALQMRRELLWFEGVKKLVPLSFQNEKMKPEKKTPIEVFIDEHKQLAKDGEKWIETTASAYTLVAALIVTVLFATAFQVPGGNKEDGIPNFMHYARNGFDDGLHSITPEVFITLYIINLMGLLSSSTSLVLFLGILTSRNSGADFLVPLPRQLMRGLYTLYLAIWCMLTAFVYAIYLYFAQNWLKTSIVRITLLVLLPAIPASLFWKWQKPLYTELKQSTTHITIWNHERYRPGLLTVPTSSEASTPQQNPGDINNQNQQQPLLRRSVYQSICKFCRGPRPGQPRTPPA